MNPESKLSQKISDKDFFITAEFLPAAGTESSSIEKAAGVFKDSVTAVNVADNHFGVALASIAASFALSRLGIEPVYQLITRDRNRIALQSDLLGAAFLGIKNVLCLSGHHQTLVGCPESANVFDIDSIQLIATVKKMNDGLLLEGTRIQGKFAMCIGAVANPYLKPVELNLIRLTKKIDAGASFIQTQAVFDTELFQKWLEAIRAEKLNERAAIIAGVMPLTGAAEAKKLSETFTDLNIPESVVKRLSAAGDETAQRKEGLDICSEIVKKIKGLPGLRGIHIMSGGNEGIVPQLLSAIKG